MKANNAKGSLILLKIMPLLALLLIGFIALCIGTKFISPLSFPGMPTMSAPMNTAAIPLKTAAAS